MTIVIYTATLLLSSSLLFFVQPMIGKMILPLLGGTPAVWNTCMVFFQAALLAGYAYAHASSAWLKGRHQITLHVSILVLALLALPIGLKADLVPPAQPNPIPWLLWTLLMCAGLPFVVVSASAPILQHWFARTGLPSSKDPYFLYAASNVGSLSALLSYPLIIEPRFDLTRQTAIWTGGYAMLIVAFIACGYLAWRSKMAPATGNSNARSYAQPVPLMRRMHWLALAAVPSSLMLGVTTHVTTNVAAVPLLWVVPLAVYLLTFILVFARRTLISRAWSARGLTYSVILFGILFIAPPQELGWYAIPVHIIIFFFGAMVCHGELAALRPEPGHLTEFYLWMSLGGVVGGLFNAMVAPLVFNTVIEYPLAVVAALMLMPGRGESAATSWRFDLLSSLGVGLLAGALVFVAKGVGAPATYVTMAIIFFLPALLCFQFKDRPVRFGFAFATILLVTNFYSQSASGDVQLVNRNFFGVKKVMYSPDHRLRLLAHGTTNHGCQLLAESDQSEMSSTTPLAYYHREGPLGDIFEHIVHPSRSDASRRIAVIGLGVGSIAAYMGAGDLITYYEIDPAVEQIARSPEYFTFLSRCKGRCDVVLGDGRLTLARAGNGTYNLLVLDAFSSDAIPTHLLSLEAMRMYASKLTENGILAFHISNGFLNLEPIIARSAEELGLACVSRADIARGSLMQSVAMAEGQLPAHYVVAARQREILQPLLESTARGAKTSTWQVCRCNREIPVWTDQYCDLIGAMRLPSSKSEPQLATRPPHPPTRPETNERDGLIRVK